ncbi:MAG TPA: hypothetical protein H9887_07065 [Candidatus Dorea intestinavium]|nr:hypothetical protein [Candidatus Dorea intestinavium]
MEQVLSKVEEVEIEDFLIRGNAREVGKLFINVELSKKDKLDFLMKNQKWATFHFASDVSMEAIPTKFKEIGQCLYVYLKDAYNIQSGYCLVDSISMIKS